MNLKFTNPIIHTNIHFNFHLFYCSDCRVVRDPQTLKSKGYGFVSFVKKSVSQLLHFITA